MPCTRSLATAACALLAAVLLPACGGGNKTGSAAPQAPGPSAVQQISSLGCARDLTVDIAPGQRLSNNIWNAQGEAGSGWSQCLVRQSNGADTVAWGWQWTWPRDSAQVLSYPAVVMGAKPWDGGAGNDSRFPRRIADTPQLVLSYELQSTGSGDQNLAASLWFTRGAQTGAAPALGAIAAELMVWSDYTPNMVGGPGPTRLLGEVPIDGRVWQVWAAQNWDGGPAANVAARWTFIVYTAKTGRTTTATLDLRRFIDDAVARGLLQPELFIASLELGNELVSGSGQTLVRSLSLTLP